MRKQILADGPRCTVPGCGRWATQVDHIIPLAKGGAPYDLGNLRPICGPCNSSKASLVRNGLPARNVAPPRPPRTGLTRFADPREVAWVEEHGVSKTIHYRDGTTHTQTNLQI